MMLQPPGSSDLARAFGHMLPRWRALTRVLDDGRIGLDGEPAFHARCSVALERKNHLFAGSDRGAERAAAFHTLIETAKPNGLDTWASPRDVLTRIAEHPARCLNDFLLWNRIPLTASAQADCPAWPITERLREVSGSRSGSSPGFTGTSDTLVMDEEGAGWPRREGSSRASSSARRSPCWKAAAGRRCRSRPNSGSNP